MRKWQRLSVMPLAVCAAICLANASWLLGKPGKSILVTHLGAAQGFEEQGLTLYSCKADRIHRPLAPYLENTIPAVARAFALGAEMADVDIHPTSDGEFVVFHDWTVDCLTDGHGTTRDLPIATLKRLDIGYRLTFDHGRTFPFRGKFVGAMPTLGEMLAAFPARSFILVIKSNDPAEADLLVDYLKRRNVDFHRIRIFGGDRPVARLHAVAPQLVASSEATVKTCLIRYLAMGWTGFIPSACRNAVVPVPLNYRRLLWGWPNLFVDRMAKVNSLVLLSGPYERHSDKPGMNFIDSREQLDALPADYAGAIFVGRMEVIGPAARRRGMLR